jgi:beta-lactam-binding protein with PASTA domain
VPKLTGLTLARARVKLKAARCALGKVTRPRRARPGLVVRSQRPAAGRTGAAGLKVALTLGPKPKPKPRRGR